MNRFSLKLLVFACLLVVLSATDSFFDGLELDEAPEGDVVVSSESESLSEYSFDAFSQTWNSDQKTYSYEDYYGDVKPDVAVRIGSETVKRWSYRFLGKEGLPVYHIRYGIIGDNLDISVVIDHDYFKKRGEVDLVAPSWGPGEVFKEVGEREAYQQQEVEQKFVFDVRFRIRFPLLGYQSPENKSSDNTVYMEFARQSINAYYYEDFEKFLELLERKMTLQEENYSTALEGSFSRGNEPEQQMAQAMRELDELTRKVEENGDLTEAEMRRFEEISAFLDGRDSQQQNTDSMRDLTRQIENFKSASLLPVVPSARAVQELLNLLTKEKVFAEYLDIQVVDFNQQAGGVVKVSGLNRIIEANLPGLDVYFVGIDRVNQSNGHLFGREPSKIFVAARMRNVF